MSSFAIESKISETEYMSQTGDASKLVAQSMRRLGYSRTEAEVYLHVLTGEGLRNLPNAISSLEASNAAKRLLDERLIGKGKGKGNYYAIDPKICWSERDIEQVWAEDLSLAEVRNLPPSEDNDANWKRQIRYELAASAARLYDDRVDLPDQGSEFTVAHDLKFEQSTVEAINQARVAVRAVSRTPRWGNVSKIWIALSDQMARGVEYRRITNIPEVIDHGLGIVRRDILQTGVKLRIVENESLDRAFYLSDNQLIVLRYPTGETIVSSKTSRLSENLKYFENRWGSVAVPGLSVVEALQQAGDRVAERAKVGFGPIGERLIKDLMLWGRFALRTAKYGWDPLDASSAERALLDMERAGLVRTSEVGKPVPVYGIDESAFLEAIRSRSDTPGREPCRGCWDLLEACRGTEIGCGDRYSP